ncbi:efflux RND transporter permease subunit [Crassaminicella thermophila]|uniref:Efflux RND transporter permease subunit n=1 Tax=Crassaminicella thermophila TaxID=2599308 RepID=A0A5C0SC23_CRATE|nr:efflux RND transporter permease subunit [Crassaminicella thermophila]QEK11236.1 efflux RND transporter permease subunit [Crassaminicella thermophila]
MNKDPKNILGRISEFFIGNFRVVYLIIIAIFLLGFQAYITLPREEMPEITLPFATITTTYTGAAPQEIESLITDKIEAKLKNVDDVKSIISTSSNGISSITVEFEIGTDINDKVNDIRNEISEIENDLPKDSDMPIVKGFRTSDKSIMTLNISGDYDLTILKDIAENIQDEIEKIEGISEVTRTGGGDREIHIYIDSTKLATYNITIDQIRNAIANSNITVPGGDIELDGVQFNVRIIGEFTNIQEIENTIISLQNGMPIYLKDIAKVEDSYEKITSYSERYEKGISKDKTFTRTIALSITRENNADIVGLSNQIKELLKSSKGSLYPEDIEVAISGDIAVEVEDKLNDVMGNALSGLFVVILVLFLFIGFRESVIVAFVIPLTLLTSFVLFKYNGMTFNTLSMLALILALGMLVDNAIVIMENIDRIRDEGLDVVNASKVATNQVAPAVFASTLTTMAAFYPMALTSGIMGEFLKTIPITIMFAIGTSFVVSIVVTPVLCSRFLSKHKKKIRENKGKVELYKKIISIVFVFVISLFAFLEDGKIGLMSWVCATLFSGAMYIKQFKVSNGVHETSKIVQKYTNMMDKILKSKTKRIGVVILGLSLFFVSLLSIPLGFLKIELMPITDSKSFTIDVELPSGYLLADTGEIVREIEEILLKYPEIDTIVSKVGSEGLRRSSIKAINKAEISIDLVDEKERERSSNEIVNRLRKDLKKIAGAKITIKEERKGPSSGKPISIQLKGENLETLTKVANDFEKILKEIDGITEISNSIGDGPLELQFFVNKERASILGLDVKGISSEIRKAIQGIKISTFKENQDEIDIVVRTNEKQIQTINDLQKIYFTSNKGEKISFSQVVSLVQTKGFTAIEHDDLKRIMKVEANITRGSNATEVVREFQSKIKNYPMPNDVEVTYGGEKKDIQESFTDMFINMSIAILLVFIILAVQFNSLSQPMVILFSVPLATIGALIGLIITGNNFGMYAFMGIVSLVGIAVNDAIVLVDYTNYLRKQEYELMNAIKEAGRTRLAPVFATSITTIGGILPLALKELDYAQLGFALIFGLIASTVLTLIFIPILYSLVEEFKVKIRKKIPIFVDNRF